MDKGAVIRMRSEGKTLQEIGDIFGVCRERIRQIVTPLSDEERIKVNARNRVRMAVSRGEITKLPCRVCGDEKSEAHHENYHDPLNVVWLCREHHADADKKVSRLADHGYEDEEGYVSAEEIAELAGVTVQRVYNVARFYEWDRIVSKRKNCPTLYKSDMALAWANSTRKNGRPKKNGAHEK